jgi:hypothetical protein
MKFARWTFIIAGIYGLIIIVPMFWAESQIGIDYPPAITHPEYYYGFGFVTLSCQVLFLLIAVNPIKYRLIIIAAVLEKIPAGVALVVLFSQQRVSSLMLSGGIIDIILGLLFIVAFFKAKEIPKEEVKIQEFESNQEG